jgi:hypothetical protein
MYTSKLFTTILHSPSWRFPAAGQSNLTPTSGITPYYIAYIYVIDAAPALYHMYDKIIKY